MDYGIDKMGAYISNTAVSAVGPGLVLQYTPQIISHTSLTDTINWMRISGYYQASGGEQYITIGNFSTDINTDTSYIQHGSYSGSYYLIDDVSIIKVAGCDTTLGIHEINNTASLGLFPNPSKGNLNLKYKLKPTDKGEIIIYDIAGKLIGRYEINAANNQMLISNEQLNNGIYFYHIILNNKVVQNDKLVIIK